MYLRIGDKFLIVHGVGTKRIVLAKDGMEKEWKYESLTGERFEKIVL